MEENKKKSEAPKKPAKKISVSNRKASYEYELLDEFDCGIILLGSEVKSIRHGNVSISEAYCYVTKDGVYIKGMHIQELKNAVTPHDPIRYKKLLITKKEIEKIRVALQAKGLTLVPVHLYNKKGLIKLKIMLGRGKKLYDKRENIKKKDIERNLKRGDD